jgi:hypothetical protein
MGARPVTLPEEALRKLAQADVFSVGDVYWIPEEHLNYDSGEPGRFCLLVHVELGGDGTPARAHLIVGSTKKGSMPRIVVESGETELKGRGYFSFWTSSAVDIGTVRAEGKFRGRLAPNRLSEIIAAIADSNLTALKILKAGS